MSKNSLFHIKNLYCSYNKVESDAVLYVKDLQIPKDKIVFLLGASGCGKSTLLETLGLMNDTIANGRIIFSPENENQEIDISQLWQKSNLDQLNQIRKKHYSFIFQNTNLMENFTAYENVCLSGMIKDNVQQKDVIPNAKLLMEKIKLPENEVGIDTLAVNLSGGQRQRLAFARAFNNNATVLFGDEPTGNLDEANANELFQIIRNSLHKGLSAIIVSHDINLAVKYADEIIVLTKDLEKGLGEIKPENIFKRPSWENESAEKIDTFKSKIRSLYKAAAEHKITTTRETQGKVNTNINYKNLFLNKEGAVLFGKKYSNLIILSTILFFTFLSIGFANGSLDYLKKKMSSAFVNWVSINIPSGRSEDASRIIKELDDAEYKKTFKYQEITSYEKAAFYVYDPESKSFPFVKARSVDVDRDRNFLQETVLAEKNIIAGKRMGFRSNDDLGVIVTENFLKKYHYPANANFIEGIYTCKDSISVNKDIHIPLPIIAIVSELPDVEVVYPTTFSKTYIRGVKGFDIRTQKDKAILFYPTQEKIAANDIKTLLEDYAKKKYPNNGPMISLDFDTIGHQLGAIYKMSFYPSFESFEAIDSALNGMLSFCNSKLTGEKATRYYDYSAALDEKNNASSQDFFSIYFNNLDSIRAFKNFFYSQANSKDNQTLIELDLTKVLEKENFNFLSKVTKYIAILLVLFSILSTSLFLYNLLKGHLTKVRMNIGTFQAIGLANREALSIYFIIVMRFVFLATIISLSLSGIVGYLLNQLLSNKLQAEENIKYFKIFDYSTALTVVVLLFFAYLISWRTINKMLNKTPGDLIYNR